MTCITCLSLLLYLATHYQEPYPTAHGKMNKSQKCRIGPAYMHSLYGTWLHLGHKTHKNVERTFGTKALSKREHHPGGRWHYPTSRLAFLASIARARKKETRQRQRLPQGLNVSSNSISCAPSSSKLTWETCACPGTTRPSSGAGWARQSFPRSSLTGSG